MKIWASGSLKRPIHYLKYNLNNAKLFLHYSSELVKPKRHSFGGKQDRKICIPQSSLVYHHSSQARTQKYMVGKNKITFAK